MVFNLKLFAARVCHRQSLELHLKKFMMRTRRHYEGLLLLYFLLLLRRGIHALESPGLPVLKVGEERRFERLPYIDGSSCEYEIEGLQIGKWYEVKISYPASIPADFDITFSQHWRRAAHGRKLLNAEKTTFYIDRMSPPQDSEPLGHVHVVVHPTGVRSIYHSKNHEFMIYNILCEEVILGIPKQAWWVGFLAVLVVCVAIYISGKIPPSIAPAELKQKHPRQTQ